MAVISTNSSIFYIRNSVTTSSYYHIAYAATNATANGTKSFKVTIPKGSANPQVDISKLGPRQWYLPREVAAGVNDTVTWTNNDTEAHTVTSGISAGIESLMNNKKGTPNLISYKEYAFLINTLEVRNNCSSTCRYYQGIKIVSLPLCKSVVCTCFLNLSILYARVFMIMSIPYLLLNISGGRSTNSSKLLIMPSIT